MWLVLSLFACGSSPSGPPPAGTSTGSPTTSATSPTTTTTAAVSPDPGPPGDCERDADHADWPGGRTLRLDATEPSITDPTTLTVTGADAGERIVFHVGDACALDCPPEQDGACFQAVDSQILGEAVADATGTAQLEVLLHPAWQDRWMVLQATAPDAPERAISQAWVDVVQDAPGTAPPLFDSGATQPISPLTLRNQFTWWGTNSMWLEVAQGRRVTVTWDADDNEDFSTACFASDSVGTCEQLDPQVPVDVFLSGPSGWHIEAEFDYGPDTYHLDIETLPTAAPVDRYPDLDGDGYGDPNGSPVASAVPVDGYSAHPGDCDDADADLRPWAPETCGDGIDQDCDGADRSCTEGTRFVGEPLSWAPEWLLVADADADGQQELITKDYRWPLSRADALDPSGAEGTWAQHAAAGDLDGDGLTDLVFAQDAVRLAPGPVSLGSAPILEDLLPGVEAEQLLAGDLSGDGADDLVALIEDNGQVDVQVYEGPIAQGAAPSLTLPVENSWAAAVALGDADGDGVQDLWTHESCLYLSAGPVAEGCIDDVHPTGGLSTHDVDGDGLSDLLLADADGARVVLTTPTGTVTPADATWLEVLLPDSASATYHSTLTPDRDGDGAPEVIVAREGGVWSVSAAAGGVVDAVADGQLLWSHEDDPLYIPVLGGDFDGDGSGDVAVAGSTTHEDVLWAGTTWLIWGP